MDVNQQEQQLQSQPTHDALMAPSNPNVESIFTDNPGYLTNQSRPKTLGSMDEPINWQSSQAVHDLDLEYRPKAYKDLTQEDCLLMVSETIKSILSDTCNDEFRNTCYALLEANSSEEVGQQFLKLVKEIITKTPTKRKPPTKTKQPPPEPLSLFPDIGPSTSAQSNENVFTTPSLTTQASGLSESFSQEGSEKLIMRPHPQIHFTPSYCGNFGTFEEETVDPFPGLDYNSVAQQIEDIFSQSQKSEVPKTSGRQAEMSHNKEDSIISCDNTIETEMPAIANLDVNSPSPPGSPSLLHDGVYENSGILVNEENQITVLGLDESNGPQHQFADNLNKDVWNRIDDEFPVDDYPYPYAEEDIKYEIIQPPTSPKPTQGESVVLLDISDYGGSHSHSIPHVPSKATLGGHNNRRYDKSSENVARFGESQSYDTDAKSQNYGEESQCMPYEGESQSTNYYGDSQFAIPEKQRFNQGYRAESQNMELGEENYNNNPSGESQKGHSSQEFGFNSRGPLQEIQNTQTITREGLLNSLLFVRDSQS